MGAALLIAAMAGVFFYERSQFETYEVSWERGQVAATTESGSLNVGESQGYTFAAEGERLSRATFELSWSDDSGEPDTLELAVEGPEGAYTDSAQGTSSPLELAIPIRKAPDTTTVTARSMEDARDQLNGTEFWTNGTGDWSFTVTLESAPGEQTPVGGQETDSDGSQEYELAFSYERWEPSLAPN